MICGGCPIFAYAPGEGAIKKTQKWGLFQEYVSIDYDTKSIPTGGAFLRFRQKWGFFRALHSIELRYEVNADQRRSSLRISRIATPNPVQRIVD